MKAICLLLVLFLFSCGGKKSITTNVYTLNLSNPSPTSISSTSDAKRLIIQSREPLSLELQGGNPFKYKYVINNKLINFFEDKSENPLQTLQTSLGKRNETVEKTKEEENDEKKQEEKKQLEENNKKLDELSTLKKRLSNNGKSSESPEIKWVNETVTKIKNQNIKITVFLQSYNVLAENSLQILNRDNKKEKPDTREEDLNNLVFALDLIKEKADLQLASYITFKTQMLSAESINIKDFEAEKNSFNQNLISIIKDYSGIKRDASKFKDLDDVKDHYESNSGSLQSVIDELTNGLTQCNSIKKDHYILPIDINGKNIDAVEISLERFEMNNPIPTDKYKYNFWVRGGLKIDISGGVFITSLVNKEYFTKDSAYTNADGQILTRQKIFKKEKGNFDFGFGSAVNISYRSAGWVNPTFNIGALFTVNQQFQLLTGAGIILGKEERIILSGGLSMGRVTTLSEKYKDDGSELYDIAEGAIPTDNKFDFGYYFGITYNFTKSKTQTPK